MFQMKNEWFSYNKVKLNTEKTKLIILQGQRKVEIRQDIIIGNTVVSKVQCMKYLVIYIDDRLNFKEYVSDKKNCPEIRSFKQD